MFRMPLAQEASLHLGDYAVDTLNQINVVSTDIYIYLAASITHVVVKDLQYSLRHGSESLAPENSFYRVQYL